MKSTLSFTMGMIAVLCIDLLLARPKYAAAGGEKAKTIQQQIVSKEREELDSLKDGNLELFGSLLADDAVFVDSHGSASKAEVLRNVAEFRLLEYSMEDLKFVTISAESGLITYKVTEKGISHGRDFAAQVYVSAVWTKQGGKWVCLFSQETAAK